MKINKKSRNDLAYQPRHKFLLLVLFLIFAGLIVRLVDLTVIKRNFLQDQGEQRVTKKVIIPANRGMLVDSKNMPIAVSTAMVSVWVNPQKININTSQLARLSKLINKPPKWIKSKISNKNKQFVYLKRHMPSDLERALHQLKITGLYLQSEFYRHYPFGSMMSHVLGFTGLNDHGQEGLELSLDKWLQGTPGLRLVETDLKGHVIKERKIIKPAYQGHNVKLTIDHRIQYIAYKQISDMLEKSGAKWGSVIVLDPKDGNVLAMVNVPDFNPNIIEERLNHLVRNRAVVDVYEPGSTAKPFTAIALLQSGFHPWSKVLVGDGRMYVQGHLIHDEVIDLGKISLAEVIKKSSNVGIAKFALQLPVENIRSVYQQLGLGYNTNSGFPGESSGKLQSYVKPGGFDHAAMAYGYGFALTHLQLAHAYAVIANDGVDAGIHFVYHKSTNRRVFSHKVIEQLKHMLSGVTAKNGSGWRAQVRGVSVAGKTGTALIANKGGYTSGNVNVSFVGFAPVDKPKLVVSVILGQPKKGWRFGGVAAAPVFSNIVANSLVLLEGH
jgi:cell division protein FtsI (penicillin-binding protein 3)